MASLGNQYSPTKSLSITAIIVSLLFSMSPSAVSITEDCGMAIYWGQDGGEGELSEVCDTTYYKYVNVAFLSKFGNKQTPEINLAGHCGNWSGGCQKYSDQIKYCQSKGIKVLLSIGGGTPETYTLISPEDATFLAEYIWNYFLGGTPSPGTSRPLGDAVFDGVDFDIEKSPGQLALYYDVLARTLASYSTTPQKVYLSAAPQCVHPDYSLDATIKTGLMNYIWVQFYNNPSCDYWGGSSSVIIAWKNWSSSIPTGSNLFLGLPASPSAAGTGYIPPENLTLEILPVIRTSSNYAGVMLWSRRFDNPPTYSAAIYPDVCPASGYGTTLINSVVDVISAV